MAKNGDMFMFTVLNVKVGSQLIDSQKLVSSIFECKVVSYILVIHKGSSFSDPQLQQLSPIGIWTTFKNNHQVKCS